MRAPLLLAMFIPAIAFADYETHVSVRADNDAHANAVRRALFIDSVREKLDACWTEPANMKAKVTFEAGTVTKVEVASKCIESVLRTVHLAGAKGKVVVNVELEGRTRFDDDRDHHNAHAGRPAKVPPAVKVQSTGAAFKGGLARDQVDRVIRVRTGMFRACYVRELKRHPKLAGKIVARFDIAPQGTVSRVSIIPTPLATTAPRVATCVQVHIKRLKFPASKTKTTVSYPFVFASS